MNFSIHPSTDSANAAAAALLTAWFAESGVRNVMLAGGNTPLELYRRIGTGKPRLSHLRVFTLDEYVGVPPDEPRNCANLIRRTAVEPWGVPAGQYFFVDSSEAAALRSVMEHERRIEDSGGLDVIVAGLGQNGHIGFNEPGSAEHSAARLVELDAVSVEANRRWFRGDYAPARGVTVGMKTILSARRVLVMAFGSHKAEAVRAMLRGPRTELCPASLLQGHTNAHLILDGAASTEIECRELTGVQQQRASDE
jgi:glucosamine-6-phosphate deaminase